MSIPSVIEVGHPALQGRARSFQVGAKIAEGDLADFYSSTLTNRDGVQIPVVLKVARSIRDNDLLENEANILSYLFPPGQKDVEFFRYLPKLYAAGHLPDRCHVSVLPFMEGYVSAAEVIAAYPKGIDFRDMVWMYKRLLAGLGFIREKGVVHGAIIPTHVLVHPDGHGAKIIGWSYALNFAAALAEAKRKADEEEAAKVATSPPPDPPSAMDPYGGLLDPSIPYPHIPRAPKAKKAPAKAADPPKNAPSVWDLLRQNNYDDGAAPSDPVAPAPVVGPPPDPNKMYVRALSVDYEAFYAPEILRKETPSPATDLYMAAKVAIALCGGNVETGQLPDNIITTDPEGLDPARCRTAIQAFLQASLVADPRKRPQDPWEVHEAFDQLLQGLVGPNKYRKFTMPGAQP